MSVQCRLKDISLNWLSLRIEIWRSWCNRSLKNSNEKSE